MNRRDFLSACVAGCVTGLNPFGRARADGPRGHKPPRYWVLVWIPGGMDAIFTTDPKTRAEVEPWVDVPYGAKAITTAGDLRLGPHFAPLAPWASKMAIVQGVRVLVANHNSGETQVMRVKTRATTHMPPILEVIGERRDTQPLASMLIGFRNAASYSANKWFGTFPLASASASSPADFLAYLDGLQPDELVDLAKALRRQSTKFGTGRGESRSGATNANLVDCAAFFERMASVPKFSVAKWDATATDTSDTPVAGDTEHHAALLQRTLWAIENDLVAGVVCSPDGLWDTHYNNTIGQTANSTLFFPQFARFVRELSTRSNAHGNLLDNTTIVLSSELGRFPQLNNVEGKDHFPEAPYVLMGAGIRSGARGAVYGATDRRMAGMAVHPRTGKLRVPGAAPVLLDDIGTTMLHLAGIDPAPNGYEGRVLEYLVRT